MSEQSFRTILFVALLLVAPAIFFLVQVIFILPPVFLLAGAVYVLKKIVLGGFGLENFTFLALFLLHLLLSAGVYWLVAWLLGKLALLAPRGAVRSALPALLLAGIGGVTQVPIYGGGGHGPAKLGPLQMLLGGLEASYGPGSMLTVYLTALGVLLAASGWWKWRKRPKRRPDIA